jgi:hypothetical protein
VILVVGAEAAAVSARDGRLVPGADSIAETATLRTAPEHLTRPNGRRETLAALRLRWPVCTFTGLGQDPSAGDASADGARNGRVSERALMEPLLARHADHRAVAATTSSFFWSGGGYEPREGLR